MNCSEARLALGADPASRNAALDSHLDLCEACAAYAREMQQLDSLLREAMAVPVPRFELPTRPYPVDSDAAAIVPSTREFASGERLAHTPARRLPSAASLKAGTHAFTRRLALAAGIAGVAVLTGLLWIGIPRASLATAVVAHMSHEPDAWATSTTLAGAAVSDVMSRAGVRLEPDRMDVTYAQRCWFRGREVPHLVVQTPDGPVTVMVLPRENVDNRVEFDDDGYHGVLVPAERGSIAVLTRDRADVDLVAAQVLAAIRYAS